MPKRQFIDRKTATTFSVVHRPQHDPLIHSNDAPQLLLAERGTEARSSPYVPGAPSSSWRNKVKQRGDLEDEFGMTFQRNEGQAAEQGVYFDDTEYDYMQHMRDLGGGGGDVTWVEAKGKKVGKGKGRLEDALAELELDEGVAQGGVGLGADTRSVSGHSAVSSVLGKERGYQDMQDVPDEIAGFQPGMDPRLREVLEALEDDAYVDEDEELFGEIADGDEVGQDEFRELQWEEEQSHTSVEAFLDGIHGSGDDDGWESDDTIRADDRPFTGERDEHAHPVLPPVDPNATPAADPTDGAWLEEYSRFKSKAKTGAAASSQSQADQSMLSSLATGRKKKRKGARTSTTNYSMTSSALARTDAQSLLDDRFDKLMEKYDAPEYEDEEGLDSIAEDGVSLASGVSGLSRMSKASKASQASNMSKMSGMSGLSRASGISTYSRASDAEAPQLIRSDFDSIMEGFLEGQTAKGGKSRRDIGIAPGRKGKRGTRGEGLRELDEIRQGLGPARMKQAV